MLLSILITGCATTTKNFNDLEIENGTGVFYGTFHIFIDGEDVTRSCNLIFMDEQNSQKSFMNIDENGFFVGKGKIGKNYLSRIACKNGFNSKLFFFENDKRINFENNGGGKKVYLGDITAFYDSSSEKTNYALLLLGGAGGGIAAASSKDYEKIVYVIENNKSATEMIYQKTIKSGGQLETVFNEIKIPTKQVLPTEKKSELLKKYRK